LVTSPREGDGKSTICANLAAVLASSGARVLLIDANLRHSSLHTILGIPNHLGLLQVLNGSEEFETVVREVGTGENLLPSGAAPEYQEPMPAGDNLDRLVKTARESYDVILVDSPPVLSWSDAMVMAPRTDGVIVVLRAGASKSEDIRLLRDRLDSAGAEILGSVLNAIPGSSQSRRKDRSSAKLEGNSGATEVTGLGLSKTVPRERPGQ
jgi:capsular exopolysaccharide synthesis family protein